MLSVCQRQLATRRERNSHNAPIPLSNKYTDSGNGTGETASTWNPIDTGPPFGPTVRVDQPSALAPLVAYPESGSGAPEGSPKPRVESVVAADTTIQ
jgi:hypothetical protein